MEFKGQSMQINEIGFDPVKRAEKALAKEYNKKLKKVNKMTKDLTKQLAQKIAPSMKTDASQVPELVASLVNNAMFKTSNFKMPAFAGDPRNAKQLTDYAKTAIVKATQIEVYGEPAQGNDPNSVPKVDADDVKRVQQTMPPADANKDGVDDVTGDPMPAAQADGTAAQPADVQTPQGAVTGDEQQDIQFTPNQPVMFISKSGKATSAQVVGKSEDGDENKVSVKGQQGQTFNIERGKLLDPKSKKPFTPAEPEAGTDQPAAQAAGTIEIPQDIKTELDKLTPQQKQELQKALAA